eukprot:TRINITY_DN598_c0_g1_i2.p1 TRINITY_DN598_c0_g1~~TRINITY_DN598_c0_g1_i2.p1  ORF type:complete len:368 (-),score=109.35 TRINITY_DN598_c0_g1_i2:39-1115(-)
MFARAIRLSLGGRGMLARSFATARDNNVVRYSASGSPQAVLKVEKEQVPSSLSGNEVLVKMLAAPINPADINMIEGVYGVKPELPAIAGLEGVGEVSKVGSSVKGLQVGDRVIPAKAGFGTWRNYAVGTEDSLHKISKDIPVEYAATLSVNPSTALRLLTDFETLKEGDVVIQNGANSMVGCAVIQIAKSRGLKTINIIRERPDFDATVERLKSYGGDIVVSEKYARTPQFKRLIADMTKPRLALNCVGGDSATELARTLAEGGTLVTYGGMSRQPVSIPTSLLIFKDIKLRGFWLTRWVKEHSSSERTAMLATLTDLVKSQKLRLHIEAHKFSDFQGALRRSTEPFRDRKVLLELTH